MMRMKRKMMRMKTKTRNWAAAETVRWTDQKDWPVGHVVQPTALY